MLLTHLSISHIIVTNICVWFKYILEETFESVKYVSTGLGSNGNTTTTNRNKTVVKTNLPDDQDCTQYNAQVSEIIGNLNPYLHPCAIEYSIICVTLFYVIWYNVGRRVKHNEAADEERIAHTRRFSVVAAQTQIFHVDCNKSAKGLFAGFLVALLTIITLIIFIVSGATGEVQADHFDLLALYLSESVELLLLVLCLLISLNAFITMRKMSLAHAHANFSISLDAVLEIFALFGSLSFGFFRILSFRYTTVRSGFLYLFLINGILSFIQGLVQTVFILHVKINYIL